MPTTCLYRVASGEVVKISAKGQAFTDRNPTYWGVVTDPAFPDGTQLRETLPDGTLGPLRVLGYAKHYVAPATVRNSTQGEIDGYAAFEQADENSQDAERVADLFTAHPQWRKAFKALIKRILSLHNTQASEWNALRAEIAAATNLSNLQSRVAANTNNQSTYTLPQALSALLGDIDPDD